MIISALQLHEGQKIPWWAGIAWAKPSLRVYVVLPLGIHIVAAFLRRTWHDFRMGAWGRESELDAARRDSYADGLREANAREYLRGLDDGYAKGVHHVAIELKSILRS